MGKKRLKLREDTKRKLLALFTVLVLGLSTLSYAVSVFLPSAPAEENISVYNRFPLSEGEIEKLVKRDKVVLFYFWSFDCDECYDFDMYLQDLAAEFNNSLIVVSLDTYNYPDIPYLDLPVIKIMSKNGYREFNLTLPSKEELKQVICDFLNYASPACERS